MRKLLFVGGLIVILAGILVAITVIKKPFEAKGELKSVAKILVEADISNILLTNTDSAMSYEYKGEKSITGSPHIDVTYNKDQAIIKVKANPQKWMNLIPGTRTRGSLLLNIPTTLVDHIQVESSNGNIDVANIRGINELSCKGTRT